MRLSATLLLYVCLIVGFVGADQQASSSCFPEIQLPEQQISISNYTTAVKLGHDKKFGRFNNRLIAIMHALDYCEDLGGAVLVLEGWAAKIMARLVPSWKGLGASVGITYAVPEGITNVQYIQATEAYYYRHPGDNIGLISLSSDRPKSSDQNTQLIADRRKRFLSWILANIPTEFCLPGPSQDYAVVKIRTLEGHCLERLGPLISTPECAMPPYYINAILSGKPDTQKIVILSDDEQPELVERLKQAFGDRIFIPQRNAYELETPRHLDRAIVQDMALAIRSSVFIAPRVSSMSIVIAQFRAALGKDPASNYVYVTSDGSGGWSVCEECIWGCYESEQCGGSPLFA